MAKSPKAPADEPRKRRPIDDDDDRPTKKGRAADDDDEDEDPLVPRKKKKSAAKPAKIGMTAVASVVGAVAVFIMLYWVYSPMGTDSSMLCYCPPETTTLIGMDVEDLVKNKQMKEFNDLILGAYKGFSEARFANTKLGIDKGVQRYLHANVATATRSRNKPVSVCRPREISEPSVARRTGFAAVRRVGSAAAMLVFCPRGQGPRLLVWPGRGPRSQHRRRAGLAAGATGNVPRQPTWPGQAVSFSLLSGLDE